jgi:hypothetical protein
MLGYSRKVPHFSWAGDKLICVLRNLAMLLEFKEMLGLIRKVAHFSWAGD